MELVTIIEIDLNRPQSAMAQGFHNGSNPRSGRFVAPDGSIETLREKVIAFAETCGVPPDHLSTLHQIPTRDYSAEGDIVIFDVQTRGVLYSAPYAACRASPALKIGEQYFKLAEIKDVTATETT